MNRLLQHLEWFYKRDATASNGELPESHSASLNVAAARGDAVKVKYILASKNSQPYDSLATALLLAEQYGHKKVSLLITKKIAEMSGDRLIEAAVEGRFNEVRTLMVMGVDVASKTKSNWTPLHFAAKYGHLSIVKCLVANGADVNIRGVGGQTPLFEAAFYGRFDVAEFLIGMGANVNIRGYRNMTPVDAAFTNGYAGTAELISVHGGTLF